MVAFGPGAGNLLVAEATAVDWQTNALQQIACGKVPTIDVARGPASIKEAAEAGDQECKLVVSNAEETYAALSVPPDRGARSLMGKKLKQLLESVPATEAVHAHTRQPQGAASLGGSASTNYHWWLLSPLGQRALETAAASTTNKELNVQIRQQQLETIKVKVEELWADGHVECPKCARALPDPSDLQFEQKLALQNDLGAYGSCVAGCVCGLSHMTVMDQPLSFEEIPALPL